MRAAPLLCLALLASTACVTARAPVTAPPPQLDGHALCGAVFAIDEGREPAGLGAHESAFADAYRGRSAPAPEAHERSAGPALVRCLRGDAAACDEAEALQPLALTELGRARLNVAGALKASLALDSGCAASRSLAADRAEDPAVKLEHLRAVQALDVDCVRCDRSIGRAALDAGQRGAAREALARALLREPKDPALLELYAPLAAAHDVEVAAATYARLLEVLPAEEGRSRQVAHRALARLHEAAGRGEEALAQIEAALKIQPADLEAARTKLRLVDGDPAKVDALRAILALDDEDGASLVSLAGLVAAQSPDEALALYDRALALGEDDAAKAARAALLKGLRVPSRAMKGRIRTVVNTVRRQLQPVYAGKKEGRLDVRVVTDAEGAVLSAEIVEDTLGAARVRAALLGHLARARIRGGAREYAFTLEFKP